MEFVRHLYALTATFPATETYGLAAQMRRVGVSVPSSIAEGAARTSKREFAHYLTMARGSLSEIDTQLSIAIMLGYVRNEEDEIEETLDQLFWLIGGLLKSVR